MYYARIALFMFLALSNLWRLVTGSVSGWTMVWSISVLLISTGVIAWMVTKGRRRTATGDPHTSSS